MGKLFRLAALSIVFLFVIATAISLMIPQHIRISRAINIFGTKDSIFSLIRDTGKWKEWHPAFMPSDQQKRIPLTHVALSSSSDSSLVVKLWQDQKKPVVNGWQIYHVSADSLTLQWYMDFQLKWYPWQKFGSLFFESTYGILMEQGLVNIRNRVQGMQH